MVYSPRKSKKTVNVLKWWAIRWAERRAWAGAGMIPSYCFEGLITTPPDIVLLEFSVNGFSRFAELARGLSYPHPPHSAYAAVLLAPSLPPRPCSTAELQGLPGESPSIT